MMRRVTQLTLTIEEVIAELRVSRAVFYRWRWEGTGPAAVRLPGGGVRIRRSALQQWLRRLENPSQEEPDRRTAMTSNSGTQEDRRHRQGPLAGAMERRRPGTLQILPAAHDTGHRDALVLLTDIGPSTGVGTAPCRAETRPPNPTAAGRGDGGVRSRLSSRVHEPCTLPRRLACATDGLDRFRESRILLRRVRGRHPRFQPHTGWRQPSLTPGYVSAVLLAARVWQEPGPGVPRGGPDEGGAHRAGGAGIGPWQGDRLAWSDWEMFVSAEALADLGFPAAAAGLANLARGRLLTGLSQGAYSDGLAGVARMSPVGDVPGMSKLVEVHFLDVVTRGESAVLALRWQATGPGGGLFPALDADIWLTPAGEHSARLSLAGVCRPPLGALGAGLDTAVFHRVADATVRSLPGQTNSPTTPGLNPAGVITSHPSPGQDGRA